MSVVQVPVKTVNGKKWADLGALALSHDIIGEKVHKADENFSFAGGHRVRLYSFRKNVHFRVPEGKDVDITSVAPLTPPRRQGR